MFDGFDVQWFDVAESVRLRVQLGGSGPAIVSHLVALDCVPIGEALRRADARFAHAWWHWFFFAQPDKPERAILADPDSWYSTGAEQQSRMGPENYADYYSAIHDPAVVVAMLEDYRAGVGVDRAADDEDLSRERRVACPTLVAWSAHDDMRDLYGDLVEIWKSWAADVRGREIDSGHHLAEDNPAALAAAIIEHCRLPSRLPTSSAQMND